MSVTRLRSSKCLALCVLALGACAPSRFVAPRVTLRPAPTGPAASLGHAEGERWWRVLLHMHSVMNFVWVYDDVKEAAQVEAEDKVARELNIFSRMRHYRPDTIATFLERAQRRGADALVLTEHNTLSHARDPLLAEKRGRTRLFKWSTEWTSWRDGGHALLLGVGRDIRPLNSRKAAVPEFLNATATARAEGGVVVVCHPTTPNSPWKMQGLPATADAVEVINSWPFDGRGSEALWHAALRGGRRLGAVAGADWHGTDAAPLVADWRVTEVRAKALEERAIYEAIGRGRTVARYSSPKRDVTLRVLVDERCREGDTCAMTKPETPVYIEVRGGYGLRLEVFDEQSTDVSSPALVLPVDRGVFRVAFTRPTPSRGFVRAVLRGVETVAAGSPVYLTGAQRR